MSFKQLGFTNGKVRLVHKDKVLETKVKNGLLNIGGYIGQGPRASWMKWSGMLYFPLKNVFQLEVNGQWVKLEDYKKARIDKLAAQTEMATQTETDTETATQTETETETETEMVAEMVDSSTQTDPEKHKPTDISGYRKIRQKICIKWQRGHKQCREETCWFAHGEHLLGTLAMKYPEPCSRFQRGMCPFTDEACLYNHK